MRVLIVEDDLEVADLLVRTIREVAWAPDAVGTGNAALEALAVNEYDIVVLDVNLPDMTGFEVCRQWRASNGSAPILMLTARTGLADRVNGLNVGADDYLPKPFAVEELLARLRALARRPVATLSPVLAMGDLKLDANSRVVVRGSESIRLSAREYGLLEYLMRNPNRVVSRSQILEHVWDDNFDPVANAVDVLIGRVRRKITVRGTKPLIHTVRGGGYMFAERDPNDAA